jgi:hypothetical protein
MIKARKTGILELLALGAGALVTALTGSAKAGELKALITSNLNSPAIYFDQCSVGTEGFDSDYESNVSKPNNPSNTIEFFIKPIYNPNIKVLNEIRGSDSMTTLAGEIDGIQLTNSSASANLTFTLSSVDAGNGPEYNFTNKNIFADLYTSTGSLVGTYDVKYASANGQTIPLTISNGLSYTMNVRFEPAKAGDFNVDGNVDILDLGILAENWLGDNCSSLNNHCDFSDMNKDTKVNLEDFAQFANQWLN